jgi:hydroxymethylglutaryl-CoA reductase
MNQENEVSVCSEIPYFYKKTREERIIAISEQVKLTEDERNLLKNTGSLPFDLADKMVENAIGAYALPLGLFVCLF